MSKTRRALALLLAAALCALCLPALAEAAPEKVQLTAVSRLHSLTPSFDESPVWQAIEEAAGVEIKWEINYSDWNERKAVLIGTNQMPDLWIGEYNLDISDIQSNQEAFVRLNDYIDASTNVKKMFDECPQLLDAVAFPDGSIYSIPQYQAGGIRTTSDAVFINKTWLDYCGLDVPTTLDELYEALAAFKEKDPNQNGKADEIPLVDAVEAINWLINSYGLTMNHDGMWLGVDDDNNPYFVADKEGFKEAVKFLAKVYQNGLCDPETFTQHWSEYYAYCAQEDAIGGVGIAWTIEALMAQHSDQYVYLPPLAGPDGQRAWNTAGSPARPVGYAISATCKDIDAAWRVIETAYSKDFGLQLAFGQFDGPADKQSLTLNEDGTYSISYPPEGTTWDTWTISSTAFRAHSYVDAETYAKIHVTPDMQATLDIEEVYTPFMPAHVMPSCYIFDSDINDELSVIKTDITSLIRTRIAAWCTGELDIETDWPDYLAELDALGLERYCEIYFDRYNANK